MAKGKSKDKRYRIIIQVGVWNKDYTRVYRYERQTLLVSAKNPQKAIQKVSVRGTILKVIAGQYSQGVSYWGVLQSVTLKHSKGGYD